MRAAFFGAAIQSVVGDSDLSIWASTGLVWAMLIVYGSRSPLSSTTRVRRPYRRTRWQRLRFAIVAHLLPPTFLLLIKIMDNFLVFEPFVSFNASTHAQSLS